MNKRHFNYFLSALVLLLTVHFASLQAATTPQDNSAELLDINGVLVSSELYLWNRLSDVLDIFQIGVALGPGLGAEVAVTEYGQFSLYANTEHGMLFPNVLPPFWLTEYYENNAGAFQYHSGAYATAAFGPWRAETGSDDPATAGKHFKRDKWDVRVQADLLLVHLYLSFRPVEFIDFFTGVGGYDFSNDDMHLDPLQERRPADQIARGLCNIVFGVCEVPLTIFRVTENEGDLPGLTKGTLLGVWHFVCREIVGVVETITFPFGWQPIIEPAYVLDGSLKDNTWKVYRPSFHKRF